jgi:RNA polymerase sigma-70 factor (ECF subfamily)
MLMAKARLKDRTDIPDEELLSRVVSGDIDAFDEIVYRYKDRLFNFVYRFVGGRETAEDIVQETFLRVFRKRREYKALANFSTWIFTIAGNLAKSELRRRKRWRFLYIDKEEDGERKMELPDDSWRPDNVTQSALAEATIHKAIDSLPAKYREVIILRDVQNMSYQEIADIVGCPVGTVKSRVNRGRLRLQGKLRRLSNDFAIFGSSDSQ